MGDSSDDDDLSRVNLLHLDENYEQYENKQSSKRQRRGKTTNSSTRGQAVNDKVQKQSKKEAEAHAQKGGQN